MRNSSTSHELFGFSSPAFILPTYYSYCMTLLSRGMDFKNADLSPGSTCVRTIILYIQYNPIYVCHLQVSWPLHQQNTLLL
jgi:hypothetical protein